ncbi:aminotransferase class V-fold PLP-dependent enzyme [Aquimarina sp. ERC-38]|uniref:aminotransferase class V-fold PLP-dependent enzyme n=1 Tax=Aquimarina sp. ERC-38 TaxID=2949996 RepID=UPI0022486F8D|nr:aminotransferase class V-fold PLP-dependent enzyme [Aquimarina sp. ERC-38]UZO81048.1 aminotransferase class V-fold PLP-dependent enzyme [Aquimarina sp. ERC-38]
MKNLRKEFPVLSQYTYLNTASCGLFYDTLLEFRQSHDLDYLIKGSTFRDSQVEFLQGVRSIIATTFHGDAERIALLQNFSLGFHIVLEGLPKKSKFLLVTSDYPSVNFAVISKGFKHYFAEANAHVEENILNTIAKEKPDVLALSMIQYLDGIAIKPSIFKELKKTYPDLLIIVDGSQFLGTRSFSFKDSGIDILGTTGCKWLLGGYGTGFFMFTEKAIQKITPTTYLIAAQKSPYDVSYTKALARFECGAMDTLAFGSLAHSLQFIQKIGWDVIEENIQEVSEYAKEALSSQNLLSEGVIKRTYHSSIFSIKGDQALYQNLKSKDIITTFRNNSIRTSFHFYNTKDDVDQLLKALL